MRQDASTESLTMPQWPKECDDYAAEQLIASIQGEDEMPVVPPWLEDLFRVTTDVLKFIQTYG